MCELSVNMEYFVTYPHDSTFVIYLTLQEKHGAAQLFHTYPSSPPLLMLKLCK